MQINNIQPSFRGVQFSSELKSAINNGAINAKRLSALKNFEKNYAESPITAVIGLTDNTKKCLDAQIYYGRLNSETYNQTFEYLTENKFRNFLGLSPKAFLNKVALKLECLEETFQIGRYAQ